ncbi:RNA polymerase I associated factor, A49-like protein [Scleroderma yunnanense]
MATAAASKKRKREDGDDSKVSFVLSNQPKQQVGPVLASFPAAKPSTSTTFDCYRIANKRKTTEDVGELDFAELQTLIAGETDAVDLFSSVETRRATVGSRYFVGVHNKKTGVTTIRQAPLHILTQEVKALKGLEPAPVSVLQRLEARAFLGEAFGTKKAKEAIKAQQRNKIDISTMESVADHLQERVLNSTKALPSIEEAQATADSTRLVPPYNADAPIPSEIYPVHNMIPLTEWKSFSADMFLAAGSQHGRTLLPFQRSKWINQHLDFICGSTSPSKTNIKILYYISCMMLFRNLALRHLDKNVLQEKLNALPSVVVDGFLSRFTETTRASSQPQFTPQKGTLLLTHMFALCLHVDDFATDTELIAKDLGQPTHAMNMLFKSLGCKISKLTAMDLRRLDLPNSTAATKRAMLKTPLEFPKPRAKRRRQGP